MFRTCDIIFVAMMIAIAAFTYKTKHDAEKMLQHVFKIRSEIDYEEDMIRLLLADWSLLTQPERLQNLVEIYQTELELHQPEPYQNIEIKDIPYKYTDISDFLQKESPLYNGTSAPKSFRRKVR